MEMSISRLLRWALAATAVIFMNGAAKAQYLAHCEIYVASYSTIPAQVVPIMQRRGDHAARACLDNEARVAMYAPVTAVEEQAAHVCAFQILPVVYPNTSLQKPTWMMTIAGPSGCPRQNNRAYVPALQIPAETFAEMIAFTDRLCADAHGDFLRFVAPGVENPHRIAGRLAEMCHKPPAASQVLRDWLLGVYSDDTAYRLQFANFCVDELEWTVLIEIRQGVLAVRDVQSSILVE